MVEPSTKKTEVSALSRPVVAPPAARFGTSLPDSTIVDGVSDVQSTVILPPLPVTDRSVVRFTGEPPATPLVTTRADWSARLKSSRRSANDALSSEAAFVTAIS